MKRRLFIGIDLPRYVKTAIGMLQSYLIAIEPSIRLIPLENLHVTLVFLGETDKDPHTIRTTIDKEAAGWSQFRLALGGVDIFDHNSPSLIVQIIPSRSLRVIHKRLQSVCQCVGIKVSERPYKPHVTIAKLKPRAEINAVKLGNLPIVFPTLMVKEVAIFQSHLGKEGATYERLEKVLLASK